MEDRGNKTIICSVFFLDIVEYSKKSVSGQISQKERFNAFLSNAIRDVPVNDRIILDTGDGAAISFLGDVEDALRAALRMRKSLQGAEGLIDPPLLVRMGVNLGPVRLVKDINGQPNIVGDGINVAQRVMGFADPGQILVSRSYFDAASRLSQEYTGMFLYCGARTDKHVREHEVYEIGSSGDLTGTQTSMRYKPRTKFADQLHNVVLKIREHWKTVLVWSDKKAAILKQTFKQSSNQKKAIYVGAALMPVVLLAVVIKVANKPDTPIKAPIKVAQSGGAASSVAQTSIHAVSAPIAVSSVSVAAVSAVKTAKQLESQKKGVASSAQKAPSQATAATGLLLFSIKPWGHVYLDGKMVGASPPLTKLKVKPGEHLIEIKNTTLPPHKQSIKIKAGDKVTIKYRFAN